MFPLHRRTFIKSATFGAAAFTLLPACGSMADSTKKKSDPRFQISLAQWSLHKSIFDKKLDHLDFAKKASSLGIYAIEYVNQFFKDHAEDEAYLSEMNKRAADAGVRQLLIMVDGEGGLAEHSVVQRSEAIKNHYKWVHAANELGCHSIRVNAFGSSDDPKVLHDALVEGLGNLAGYAKALGINVIVENHGGISSNAAWLAGVMKEINMDNCGTLPDFGNFCITYKDPGGCISEYDRYKGVEELLPFAKAVSAKSYHFAPDGTETKIDYERMMKLIKASSYSGHIGIEYEGSSLSEEDGIIATKRLLEKVIA